MISKCFSRGASHVFTSLNLPGKQHSVGAQSVSPFIQSKTIMYVISSNSIHVKLLSFSVFHFDCEAQLTLKNKTLLSYSVISYFCLVWRGDILLLLSVAPPPVHNTGILGSLLSCSKTFLHLFDFTIFSQWFDFIFMSSLSCTSTWTHRLPILSDAAQTVSHPRAFRQRLMLINAVPIGGNALGLYLSPSYHFFFLTLNLYVGEFIAPISSDHA